MSGENESDNKQYEPTSKKLDDARKKGDIARSSDLNTAAGYAGFVLVSFSLGANLLARAGTDLSRLIENSHVLSRDFFDGGAQTLFAGIIYRTVWTMAPWYLAPAIFVLLSLSLQRAFVVAPTKLQPKLNRISLLANAENKFGRQGLFEFLKSFVKLSVFSVFLGLFLAKKIPDILMTVNLDPRQATSVMVSLAVMFIIMILVVALLIGVVDFLWQAAEHLRKNRMSRQELVDEAKQMEGDPQLKQKRRQRAQEIALNQMLADVPNADVVIVNPTHYAVALKWSRSAGSAPTCVAKGVDEIAARIREISQQSGIPIHRDPVTARELFAVVGVGEQIWPEHYRAVAAAIRFADAMANRAKSASWKS